MAWIEWSPRGEGIDGPKNRADFGMLMLWFIANDPSWKQSPNYVTRPGMEEAVMAGAGSRPTRQWQWGT